MKRRLALLALVAAPVLARAQSLSFVESNDQDQVISIKECNGTVVDNITLNWTISSTSAATYDLWISDQADCPPASTTSTAHVTELASGVSASGSFPTSGTLPIQTMLNDVSIANCDPAATNLYVCMFSAGTTTSPVATLNVPLDFATPPAPVQNPLTPGDSALNVSWQAGNGTVDGGTGAVNSWKIYYGLSGTSPLPSSFTVTNASATSARITGLTNGVAYDVQVSALTVSANESPLSNVETGTPEPVDDFWRLYKSDGGSEQGGCAAGAGGLMALLALLPVALRLRRRRS